MIKKVHLRLTLLCTAVTGAIVIVMTLLYLYVSESNMRENHYYAFQNDVNNIVNGLQNQSILSTYYLSSLESGGRYLIFIEDNGSPLLFGNIVENEERTMLLEQVKAYYEATFEIAPSQQASTLSSYHFEFIYTLPENGFSLGQDFYVCVAYIPLGNGGLTAYIIAPVSSFYKQLFGQRLLFAIINLLALVIFYVFFYFFTNHLLKPVVESQEKQNSFIASASHELRTPLSVILSCAALIPDSHKEKQEQFCNTIKQEGGVMKRLLTEMLSLADFDSRKIELHKEAHELDTLILNCVETFEPVAREKNIRLTSMLPDDSLPHCICDKHKIEQLLSILVHNAISYTNEGGSIQVSLKYMKKHFIISVADTGIGISDEDKKRIFERFYRADASHNAKEHFGLGLSIAQTIVRQHRGKLRVTDTEGGGSTFIVELG